MINRARKKSFAFCGGAFGDEGKGRIVDKFVSDYAKKGPVVVYRDNGGSNAGHTVELNSGQRVALHQLPSGVFVNKCVVILGKGMVLHPADLIEEIRQVKKISGGRLKAKIMIDEMAVLCLDTHRAFEAVLKEWQEGGKGATGRGIASAYADVLLRHPLRMKDLVVFDQKKIIKHYKLYKAFISGLGANLAKVGVPYLNKKDKIPVGTFDKFLRNLKGQSKILKPYISEVFSFLKKGWVDKKYTFIFEKGQAIGLDLRYGVYPDVTASDCTFDGLLSSTEGIINSKELEVKAGVIKATYMSSVGIRRLPTIMEEELATRIREDANEYGATTQRPRGIAYLDLPALKFFAKVGKVNYLVLTHMDIVYPNTPIKICLKYEINGKEVPYRPDQNYLDLVKPKYIEFPTWDREKISKARKTQDLQKEAKKFLNFISKELGISILMITTGPKREQGIVFT